MKFQAAAAELNLISDEFFELRNHNAQYASALENLKNEIKEFRSKFDDSNEITSSFAKDILKIARRIVCKYISTSNLNRNAGFNCKF